MTKVLIIENYLDQSIIYALLKTHYDKFWRILKNLDQIIFYTKLLNWLKNLGVDFWESIRIYHSGDSQKWIRSGWLIDSAFLLKWSTFDRRSHINIWQVTYDFREFTTDIFGQPSNPCHIILLLSFNSNYIAKGIGAC